MYVRRLRLLSLRHDTRTRGRPVTEGERRARLCVLPPAVKMRDYIY